MDPPNTDPQTLKQGESPEPQTIIQVGAEYYILASSLSSRRPTRELTNGESFAVFDVGGDILESPLEAMGYFHRDTRYLSRFELKIAGQTPFYLNSNASNESAQLRINLSNPDLGVQGDTIQLPRDSIQIERDWVLLDGTMFHKVIARNYTRSVLQVPLDFRFGVDFADLFEVRGIRRACRGNLYEPVINTNTVRFSYRGLDGILRFTDIVFETLPVAIDATRASFLLILRPGIEITIEARVAGGCDQPPQPQKRVGPLRFDDALAARRAEIAAFDAGWSKITASNELIDSLLRRSSADLTAIIRYTPEGTFIMAGIPWFATLFGRDSIITSLFTLPFNPGLAAGTLKTLAKMQGSELNEERDEQPGKIIHEIRAGEMAATGEVPFGRYYGSIDSTPLFLWLLGRYVETSGDLGLAEELWSNVERALQWIERWGDRDGDGYVEYLRETPRGLGNQGWKDSFDAISHVDGTLARAPIALCEVQGYVYAAYSSIAEVAMRLGHDALSDRLLQRAATLKIAFSRDFWFPDEGTLALALDAEKRPCRVMASNAAHCLATGILDNHQAMALSQRLLGDEMFTGWGIRTLSTRERQYNPMSYHNGSVWPHDNAIAAWGLSHFQQRTQLLRLMDGLLDAAVHLNTGSLPELFCGFPRDERLGPVPYPVACHPQAWSAASVFMLLQAALGLQVLGFEQKLVIHSPILPTRLDWIKIEDLKVGAGTISLTIHRTVAGAAVEMTKVGSDVSLEIRQ